MRSTPANFQVSIWDHSQQQLSATTLRGWQQEVEVVSCVYHCQWLWWCKYVAPFPNNKRKITSFIFSNHCILVIVAVTPDPIPGTLDVGWEYTPTWENYINMWGTHPPTCIFLDSGRNSVTQNSNPHPGHKTIGGYHVHTLSHALLHLELVNPMAFWEVAGNQLKTLKKPR